MFLPQHGAIFDLGGEVNRVAVQQPGRRTLRSARSPQWRPMEPRRAHPRVSSWMDSRRDRGRPGRRRPPVAKPQQPHPARRPRACVRPPCGLTFRYASIAAGNNGNPAIAFTFWPFDAELDAVAALNEDDVDGARCPVGQVCRGGACIDPCSGVLCPTHRHCGAGRCTPGSTLDCSGARARCTAPYDGSSARRRC
jgi:hypothetical protein